MSFISEVINIVKENEISDARACVKKLTKEIQNLQNESKVYIGDHYIEFNDAVTGNDEILVKASHLTYEVDQLFTSIERDAKEEILAAADDVHQYLRELEELRIGARVSKKLIRIDELFKQLNETKESKRLSTTRDIINDLRDVIFDQEDKDIIKELDSFQNMKFRWHIEHETLLDDLQTQFNSLVQLQEKTFQNTKCVDVKISNDKDMIELVLFMLFETNFNANRIYTFLLKNVFEPIITRPVSFEINKTGMSAKDEKTNEDFTTFTLSFSTKPFIHSESINLRPNYKDVFACISKVFHCLRNLNIDLPNGKQFFQQMAERIGDDVYKLLIDECLTFSVPNTIEDLKTSSLADEVRQLNGFFNKIEFTTEDNNSKLIEFADKIDVIFKKRFCLKILNSATDLMRKDLHEMQIVEESKGIQFPRCMVSRNTFELIDLMEQVLREADESSNKSVDAYVLNDIQERLQSTIPMILEQYAPQIISVHGKFLQTIPQQTALFHNNCSYLAWWFSKYSSEAKESHLHMERCESIVIALQEQGSKQFASQISNQRSQLAQIMKEFGKFKNQYFSEILLKLISKHLFTDLSDSMVELGPQPTKIIRQCLRQLDLLKNVWQTILPEMVYNKTMGTIVNDFCDELIRKIMSREDISSAVANGLVSILETIIERVPAIFSVFIFHLSFRMPMINSITDEIFHFRIHSK